MTDKSVLPAADARLIVLGSAALTDGFSLVGAEIHPDADVARVEEVLAQLIRDGSSALVLIEGYLSRAGGPSLERLRNEGGRIVVVAELPPLAAPRTYTPAVDDVVRAILGPEALN